MADSKVRANMLNLSGDYPFTGSVTGHVGDGSITNAKLSGTISASKLTGAMPALDGSTLTGIPGITKSASDPAIDTNPSGGVGTLWANSTSGEMFVCTDATAGANVWTNVGPGTGDIQPYHGTGSNYGFAAGGNLPGGTARIEKIDFSSDGNSTSHGDLFEDSSEGASAVTTTHGYHMGGYQGSGVSANYHKFAFANNTTGTDVNNLTGAKNSMAGHYSTTDGFVSGGHTIRSAIDKFNFASGANATAHGDLTAAGYAGSGSQSHTHGYNSNHGGNTTGIEKFAFTSNVTATNVGNTSVNHSYTSCSSDGTNCFIMGRNNAGPTPETIEKFPFASESSVTDHGDLHTGSSNHAGMSATTHGYVAGGGDTQSDSINKFAYASNTTGTDVGNLVSNRRGLRGTQY
jgi:hypothetical protein